MANLVNKIPSLKSLNDPLIKNSFFLMISTLTSSFSGFFFWMVVARFYPAYDVGLAAAIISPMVLISILSMMGFDISLIKYISEIEEKDDLINTCFSVIFIVALLLTIVFVAGIEFWSPSLSIIKENTGIMVIFFVFSMILPFQLLQSQGIFVGFRKTVFSFYQAIITLFRIVLPPFLVVFGSMGILIPYGLTPILSFIAGTYFVRKIFPYKFKFKINREILSKILFFSSGNYLSRIFEVLPTFILPVMVLNKLGAEANAYFYIAWQISMLIIIFSKSISNSLFAELMFNKEDLSRLVKKSIKIMSVLLVCFIGGTFLLGKYFLLLFGRDYAANSFTLLCLLVLASIPFSFNTIYVGIMRSKGDYFVAISVYGLAAVLALLGSYIFMDSYGLSGVAYSWIFANIISSVLIAFMIIFKKIRSGRSK